MMKDKVLTRPPKSPIIIDTREPADLTQCLSMLVSLDKIPVRQEHLDSADYLMLDYRGTSLGIERKTPLDFVGSIIDGRLESQLERMLLDYDHRLLVIHGKYAMDEQEFLKTGSSWNMRTTKCRYAAFQAKLLSIQARFAVRVLVTGTDQELAVLLRTLYRQGEEGRFHV